MTRMRADHTGCSQVTLRTTQSTNNYVGCASHYEASVEAQLLWGKALVRGSRSDDSSVRAVS